MIFEPLFLEGAYRIRLEPSEDDRGHFARTFCAETFARHGLETNFVQRSVSFSRRAGTLRGLHFQAPPAQETKIVRCTRGAAFDVVVDLRPASATYGRWHAEELKPDNGIMLYVPKGFAHGLQTLADATEISYEITPAYVPGAASGIRWNDPKLGIPWPISEPTISERDRELPDMTGVAL